MSALGWWLVGIGAVLWLVGCVGVALVIGGAAARRDAQKPAAPARVEVEPLPKPIVEADPLDVESDMDVFLSMIRDPSEPCRYRGEQR